MYKPILVVLLLIVNIPAHALRCDGKLIQEGDEQYRVIKLCGKPDYMQRRSEFRTRSVALTHRSLLDIKREYALRGDSYEETEEILIEEWIYDFGRSRFSQKIHFENGEVVEIERLGYGG